MQYDGVYEVVECEGSLRFIPPRIRGLIQTLVAESWREPISPQRQNNKPRLKKLTSSETQKNQVTSNYQNNNDTRNISCDHRVLDSSENETYRVGCASNVQSSKGDLSRCSRQTAETSFPVYCNFSQLSSPLSLQRDYCSSRTRNVDYTYQLKDLSSSNESRPQLQLCNIWFTHQQQQRTFWQNVTAPCQSYLLSRPVEGPENQPQLQSESTSRTASTCSVPFLCEKRCFDTTTRSALTSSSSGRTSLVHSSSSSSSSVKRRYFSRASKTWPFAWSKLFISYFLLISTAFISTAAMEIQRKSLVLQRPVTAESANEDSSDNIITKDQNVDSSSTNGSPISNTATPRDRRSSGSLLDAIPPGAPSSGGRGVVSSTKCELDKCNEWLHMASIFNRIAIEQCVIFTNDLTCLIGIEKQCYLNLYYKGHRGWAEQKYEELNCSQVLWDANNHGTLPKIHYNTSYQAGGGSNLCYLDEQEHHISLKSTPVFCSLFGDPHLYTYGGRQQTCATVGAWPLVDNAFFTIQALNVPMGGAAPTPPKSPSNNGGYQNSKTITTEPGFDPEGPRSSSTSATVIGKKYNDQGSKTSLSGSGFETSDNGARKTKTAFYPGAKNEKQSSTSPSAITRVMIIFRAKMNCVAKEKIYDTTEGVLPPSFNDGTSSGGHGDENLSVVQVTNGSHVELSATFLNTTIIIRRIGRYLSISVVSPVDVARSMPSYTHSNQRDNFHMELCSAGCPDVETLAEFPASPPRISEGLISYETAKDLCSHLSDFFLDSCIFDVMVTGDANTFVEIGKRSKEDVNRLKSKRSTSQVDYLKYFPSGPKRGIGDGAAVSLVTSNRAHNSQYLMWLLIFLTFLFQLKFSCNLST